MASWEHRRCGTIFHNCRLPPEPCDFCAAAMIRITKFSETGWRRVGTAAVPEVSTGKAALAHTAAPAQRQKAKAPKKRGKGRRTPSTHLRERVYKRDGYRCVECGCDDKGQLTTDHKIPWSKGGPTSYENLQTMCFPCNQAKGNDVPPEKPRGKRKKRPVAEMTGWADG